MHTADGLVARIYDCAANPALWNDTLSEVRDVVGGAYVAVFLSEDRVNRQVCRLLRHSPWDVQHLRGLEGLLGRPPDAGVLHCTEIDRDGQFDVITVAKFERAPSMTSQETRLIEHLSPHIRRAAAINEVVDQGRRALALFDGILDCLSTPVLLVGPDSRVAFANAAAEAALRDGSCLISLVNGGLVARCAQGDARALNDAISRAISHTVSGSGCAGRSGVSVPLIGATGDRMAAYVLPLSGDDRRATRGGGYAAVFLSCRGENPLMAIEILRSVFDLTTSEARVALRVAKGDGPATIADATGVSVNTVRSHLARAFAKCDASDQVALAATVNAILPPIAAT